MSIVELSVSNQQGKGKIGEELGEGEEQQAASTREVRQEESQFRFRV
jgi:hypothetical protein